MLLIPCRGRAHLAVCDAACLQRILPFYGVGEIIPIDAATMCLTCLACGTVLPGRRCVCEVLDVSCARHTWLLTAQPKIFFDTLHELCGPVELTDADWDVVLDLAEQVWAGGIVALQFVRDRPHLLFGSDS